MMVLAAMARHWVLPKMVLMMLTMLMIFTRVGVMMTRAGVGHWRTAMGSRLTSRPRGTRVRLRMAVCGTRVRLRVQTFLLVAAAAAIVRAAPMAATVTCPTMAIAQPILIPHATIGMGDSWTR